MTPKETNKKKTNEIDLTDGDRHLFNSYHQALKDAERNISEKVVADVSEVIKPVMDKMNEGFRRSDKRMNNITFVGGLLFFVLVIGLFIVDIRSRSNKASNWDSQIESTLRPSSSNAQNFNVVSGR